MTRERSFHEILEEKLHGSPGSPSADTPSRDDVSSMESLADLLETLGNPVWTFASVAGARRAYPRGKGPKPSTRPTRGPVHALSDRQKDAVVFFERFGERLAGDYSTDELKTAYRRLALRLHPDVTRGSAEPFLELRGHYKTLETVFERPTAAAAA